MRLDYFYNTEGENFRFYQIPALLLEEEEYRGISDTAKILYGVLLSGWHYQGKITGSKKIPAAYISRTI